MQAPPTLSIAMCTYNGEKYLAEQLDSILNQTFGDFELIIADDRSTDGTVNLLLKYAAADARIRLIHNEKNIGYNRNFEQVLKLCRGKFISTADQDDIWLPQKNERLIAALQNEKVSLAHVQSVRLENGSLNYKKRRLQHHFHGDDTRRFFLFNHVMGHDAMFRAKLLPELLPFPAGISYDWWIAVHATLHGMIWSVPEILVHHRIHESNSFFTKSATARKRELDIDESLAIIATIPGLPASDKAFLHKTLALVRSQANENPGFNSKMFFHLFSNRQLFFGHKRRKVPIISHLKYALKYARYNFRGKGLSI